ncbi:response regulator transcription factor [Faecalibacterium prausnitzii]|uniref:response regulator transcription factor n=1 Tax=Faecalibacterium prausnitzii TaxID=853 RepID=UPI0012DF3711|nr:response regulator [Faecalibacterium prausnitzii]
MYTLLIVDDEEIEREGMAQFIPWDSYEMKVVSTARNGAEGLEKIAKFRPDLAIVDIKMPVMNGIEMIRQAREQYPDMTFVVLSGYGDYEFTSQAMELGVRHYILKPCDESKMIPVLNKAFDELEDTRKKNAHSEKLETEARLLKPYAREQLFRDLLLGKAQASSGARQLPDELGGEQRTVLLLDFRLKCGFDSLERYVVGNMLGDLLPDDTLLMTTGVDRDVLVLADAMAESSLETAVQVLKKEFKRFETLPMLSSASRTGTLAELSVLFRQAQELLQLNPDENETVLLRPSRNAALPETVNEIFDMETLRQSGNYEELLQELAFSFAKMEVKNYYPQQRKKLCELAWKLLFEEKAVPEDSLSAWADALTAAWNRPQPDARSREIFLAIYENLSEPEFGLQTIAQHRLFMSEDHLRRIFSQMTGNRFSAYLEHCRIMQARRLLEFQPDMKISRLAELVGYPLDGQYFSKVFRKICGVTPTEYRNHH